jgi:Lantibiotic dehydratase, N terminus
VTIGKRAQSHPDSHVVPLPGTDWKAWRDALLRSAGFPAAGLDRFSAPECAAVADAYLDGKADQAELEAAHASALTQARRIAAEIAADPLFREALTWQNPAAAAHLGSSRPSAENPRRRRQYVKARENTIARYWQRYCGKNDTIGFFGPVAWATLDPQAPAVRVRCGDGLVRDRTTYYEYWALQAYANTVAADPVVRPWLPVGLHPHVAVDGSRVLRAGQDPLPLSRSEADLLSRCDGHRPAAAVADGSDLDRASALAALEGLAARGVLWWGVNMPQDPRAEGVLRATLGGIADPAVRERALAGLARLDAARDAVSAAGGDPDKLAVAMAQLDAEFTSVTGTAAERLPGQMYAGRRTCYEEAVRDVEVTFGGPVLEALTGPLATVLLPAGRWLSVALVDAYTDAFRRLYAELGGSEAEGVPLDRFWMAALPLLDPTGPVVEAVAAEFTRRWMGLLGLDHLPPGTRRVTHSSVELADQVQGLFAAARPAWAGARIHSPDLQICASSVEALDRGDFTLVLGELHAVWGTLDCAVFVDRHPDPARLRAATASDVGRQILPLYATWCPQFTPRLAPNLADNYQLAFAPEPGADPARLLPGMTMTVVAQEGELLAVAKAGRRWPLFEVFAIPVAWAGSDMFRMTSASRHNPRITIDRMVIGRETWRTTVAEAWLTKSGGVPEYLAARQLRRALGLPEKVFARIGTEMKPVYLDLTSPRYVSAFATMLRTARAEAGDETPVVITELLPGPDQAWLPGPGGERYFSELRIHLRDPVPADRTNSGED